MKDKNYRQASVILITLILTVVFASFGFGLYYFSKNSKIMVNNQSYNLQIFNVAETAVEEALAWLKDKNDNGVLPSKDLKTVDGYEVVSGMDAYKKNISMSTILKITNSKDKLKFDKYTYSYYIEQFTAATKSGAGVGSNISLGQAYSGQVNQNQYFYKITAIGHGPNNLKTKIEVIVSYML